MTRRDYCSDCREMVSDYDVACVTCGQSQCFGCITTYDYKTELCALIARLNVLSVEYILVEELAPLKSNLVCVLGELPSNESDIKLVRLIDLVEQYQQSEYVMHADPKTEITDQLLIGSFMDYFNEDYYENFVCYDCNTGMNDTKKIALLEAEIVRLRSQTKDLKIRLDEYSESGEEEED